MTGESNQEYTIQFTVTYDEMLTLDNTIDTIQSLLSINGQSDNLTLRKIQTAMTDAIERDVDTSFYQLSI